jgi:hypothetical protein
VCSKSVDPDWYATLIEQLKGETDAHARSAQFACAYARFLRRVPNTDELLTEYEKQGLNTGPDHDQNRQRRLSAMHDYLARTFDSSRLGYDLSGYEDVKDDYLAAIKRRLTASTNLEYKQGDMRRIKIEELAMLVFAIERSPRGHGRPYNTGSAPEFASDGLQVVGDTEAIERSLGSTRGGQD